MRDILILMTALVPTTGHEGLIRFAATLPNSRVWVMVSERSHEPTTAQQRITALREALHPHTNIVFRSQTGDKTPQNPEDHPLFWDWWRDTIRTVFPELPQKGVTVVASEPYGQNLAKALEGNFYPYDLERQINPVRGSVVRGALMSEWQNITAPFRKNLSLVATIMGQESVGKTTITNSLGQRYAEFAITTPEYARPYLETVGPELTQQKMFDIEVGQGALQRAVKEVSEKPIIVQDTDLYSTVGYYDVNKNFTFSPDLLPEAFALRSDLYFIMPDDVPFTPDSLRYGGNVRETDRQYWVDLAKTENLNYILVPEGTIERKEAFIWRTAVEAFHAKNRGIAHFVRD